MQTQSETDSSTRQQVLRLVVEDGPVSVLELSRDLDLTPAGVRRHVAALEDAGQVVVFEAAHGGPARRGRPARRYVATGRGQAALSSAYADLATRLLDHLGEVAGPEAVRAFATLRAGELAARHAEALGAAGDDVTARADALAAGLAGDGYAASVRPVRGGRAVQLCQGHCPVQAVASQFPELCEAETRMFSEVLGVHVQRLSTLAAGGHVCTTHVPLVALGGPADHAARGDDHDHATPGVVTERPASGGSTSDRPVRGTMEGAR